MGYHSEVCMVIRAPKEWLVTEIATMRLTGDELRQQALDELMLIADGEDSAILYLRENCNWYDNYPDVSALESVWNHFVELQTVERSSNIAEGIPYDDIDMAFVRIGEDNGDVETRYYGDNSYTLAQVNRSTEINFDAEVKDIRPRLNPAA